MTLPIFQPILTADMEKVLGMTEDLSALLSTEGRPVAISMPNAAVESAISFQNAMDDLSINGRIFLAHKATSNLEIITALNGKTSIDVASKAELDNAMWAGYSSKNIVATGPKSNQFLTELKRYPDCTLVIDSYSELLRLEAVAKDEPAKVLLRLTRSVLNLPSITKKSRFGLDESSLEKALILLIKSTSIGLDGLAFHLDSQSMEERQHAMQKALDILLRVQQQGFTDATVLDIGGGYGTNYGVSNADVQSFENVIKKMVLGEGPIVTWQSRSYGLSAHSNRIRGDLSGVDSYHDQIGADRLRSILEFSGNASTTLAHQLNENLIELWIEPGSSLCSAAGMFVAEVIEVRDSDDEYTVVVDAHRNQICFEGNEHISDPILVSKEKVSGDEPFEAYVVGHLCMESDFMSYRKIRFPREPQTGDMLVWTHTGAYRSHFSASQAIGHPAAARYTLKNELLVKDER